MQIRLTKHAIDRLKHDPGGKQQLYWDSELKGFGVLVSGKPGGARSYVVQHRLRDGKQRRVTVAPVGTVSLEAARGMAREVIGQIYTGIDPKQRRAKPSAELTLRTALEGYLKGNTLSARTVVEYSASVKNYLGDWLDRPLRDITKEMVEAKHAEVKGAIERAARSPLASGNATANMVFRVFRAVFNWALDRDDTLPANPVRRLKKQWFAVPVRSRMVPADRLAEFWAALDGLPNPIAGAYLKLVLYTGMRRREAAALRWDEVDFALKVIRLPAARTKAGRRFDLPMSDIVRDLLVARRAPGIEQGGWVFPGDGASGHLEQPKHALQRVADATGIIVSSHDLRRSFATVAQASGVSGMALKALLNHSAGSDVTAGYVQLEIEELRVAAQKAADRLKQLCRIPAPEGVAKLA